MFTINNPAGSSPRDWEGVQYCIWQLEKGENGTPHLQGYVVMKKRSRLSAMKKLDPTAHWEVRKGTHQQAVDYCKKEETRIGGPWEIGAVKGQGTRSDLLAVKDMLDSGRPMREVATTHFGVFTKYYKGFNEYLKLTGKPREGPVTVTVYYGPSGTGKTRRAAWEAGVDAYWLAPPNVFQGSVWWDGYDGETTVVIDEFYGWIPREQMLRICDRYPLMVQTKGGNKHLRATRFIITSNVNPSEWWPRKGLGAMERRLTEQVYMGGPDVWEEPELHILAADEALSSSSDEEGE